MPGVRPGLFVPPDQTPGSYQIGAALCDPVSSKPIDSDSGSTVTTLATVQVR